MISLLLSYGGIGEVVNTVDCGSIIRGFDSHILPPETPQRTALGHPFTRPPGGRPMTEQEVRHVSDRYQQPHGGEGVRRAGGGSPVPGGYLSGDSGAGQRPGVYRPPAVQPPAVRQSATPRDALSHGGTVGSAPDSGRGGVPHHVGGHHPHRYLHAAGSGEDAPAYSGGLSDDRLLSGEE